MQKKVKSHLQFDLQEFDPEGRILRYVLALYRMHWIGASKINSIIDEMENRALFDPEETLQLLTSDASREVWEGVEKDLEWSKQSNCYIVPRWDKRYPPLLNEIPDPPPVLFVRGDLSRLLKPQIAIVGSRNPSPVGLLTAKNFARHFSEASLTVTSGLAIGIDTAGHAAAVLEQGGTIAVLGNSLETVYPASNQKLSQLIVQNGALVSEFPIGTKALPSNFPRRNRIISGLSLGTLVVEAALKSGSLITTRFALEQGREVFAIPGSIHSPLAKGCHSLIRQGAKLVETAQDVLEELSALLNLVQAGEGTRDNLRSLCKRGSEVSRSRSKGSKVKQHKVREDGTRGDKAKKKVLVKNNATLSPRHESLLAAMGFDVIPMDLLVEESKLTAGEVSIMLLELELKGQVASVPGGFIRLVEELVKE